MSVSDADIAFATDLFSDLGALTTRKMFGGICLYQDGTVFALMTSDGQLFLKTRTPEAIFGEETFATALTRGSRAVEPSLPPARFPARLLDRCT